MAPHGGVASLRRRFLWAYGLASCSDWLQGPYFYAVYRAHGLSHKEVTAFFAVGFAASMAAGAVAGAVADALGRRRCCLFFCALSAAACASVGATSRAVLLAGRVSGGVATALYFCVFEAWLGSASSALGLDAAALDALLSEAATLNGLIAIASGLVANAAAAALDTPAAPFAPACACLAATAGVVAATWDENYGAVVSGARCIGAVVRDAVATIRVRREVALVGLVQISFEGALYVFVALWAAALEEAASPSPVRHGLVFACLMLCVSAGGLAFRWSTAAAPLANLLVAGVSLATAALPIAASSFALRFAAFCVFEACVGFFWPATASLRARLLPAHARGAVLTLLRAPVNVVVVAALLTGPMPARGLLFCASLCAVAAAAQAALRDQPRRAD
jgi:MFS family permease